MIIYTTGDLLQAPVEALVNAVNCVGVMGKGIALQFKWKFPDNFEHYHLACQRGLVEPGKMCIFATGQPAGLKFIINFPTKRHWKQDSTVEDVAAGLRSLAITIPALKIKSIAIPALGCGNGGLQWSIVRGLIEQELSFLDVEVFVYEPQ